MSEEQELGHASPQFLQGLKLELRARGSGELGFQLTNTSERTIAGIKLEWEYEAATADHPRRPPFKDRLLIDLAPNSVFERWFHYSGEDEGLWVLAALGEEYVRFDAALPSDRFRPIDDEVAGVR